MSDRKDSLSLPQILRQDLGMQRGPTVQVSVEYRAAQAALFLEMLDVLQEVAADCEVCDGTGTYVVDSPRTLTEPCTRCARARTAIAKATGEKDIEFATQEIGRELLKTLRTVSAYLGLMPKDIAKEVRNVLAKAGSV